jgi:hypothetical protein
MSEELITVARYRDLPEALLAQGMLQAAGIACELVDENIVRMDWFWSNMVGGVRLQVDRDVAAEAIEVLASPIPAELPAEDDSGEFHQPACPKCGSLDISHNTRRQWVSAALLYVTSLPIPLPKAKSWRCWDCGAH